LEVFVFCKKTQLWDGVGLLLTSGKHRAIINENENLK